MGYGNLAYEWEDDRFDEQVKEKRKEITADRKKQTVKTRAVFVTYVLAVILAAIFMIGKNVAVYEGELKVEELSESLAAVESYTSQKRFELEEHIDLTEVEEIATTKLGMQRPGKNQIVYVDIKQDDVCELTSKEVEGVGNNVSRMMTNIKDGICDIFGI